MRIVMLGSPAFSLPTLQALLHSGHELVAVVTQPDRPAGRGHASTPPPLKRAALEQGIRVLQPDNVSAPEFVALLQELSPDVHIVAAYGQILRQRVLDVPARGNLNIHASLLPRHRGASPIAAAILAGDDETGVTIMEVVRALDAGPVVAQTPEPILPEDTTGSLEERLARAGAELLASVLDPWARGEIQPRPQDESLASYAPQIKREEALIDWRLPAQDIWRRVRAYNPWPVAFTAWQGEEIKVLQARPLPEEAPDEAFEPGTVVAPARAAGKGLVVQTGDGWLALELVQRPGRRPMSGRDLLNGLRGLPGATLGA